MLARKCVQLTRLHPQNILSHPLQRAFATATKSSSKGSAAPSSKSSTSTKNTTPKYTPPPAPSKLDDFEFAVDDYDENPTPISTPVQPISKPPQPFAKPKVPLVAPPALNKGTPIFSPAAPAPANTVPTNPAPFPLIPSPTLAINTPMTPPPLSTPPSAPTTLTTEAKTGGSPKKKSRPSSNPTTKPKTTAPVNTPAAQPPATPASTPAAQPSASPQMHGKALAKELQGRTPTQLLSQLSQLQQQNTTLQSQLVYHSAVEAIYGESGFNQMRNVISEFSEEETAILKASGFESEHVIHNLETRQRELCMQFTHGLGTDLAKHIAAYTKKLKDQQRQSASAATATQQTLRNAGVPDGVISTTIVGLQPHLDELQARIVRWEKVKADVDLLLATHSSAH